MLAALARQIPHIPQALFTGNLTHEKVESVMCMRAYSGASTSHTDSLVFLKSGRAHFQMCGKAGWVSVLSEEGAPSAVPTRKHRGGGKGPQGSGKLVSVKTSVGSL